MRPSRAKHWGALAVVGGLGILLWVVLGKETASTLAKPDPKTSRSAEIAEAEATPGRMAGATRSIDVQVEACRGPASDALVFVKVGDALVSGRTDAGGRARFVIAPGRAEVRARVGAHEVSMMAGDAPMVVVKACDGGVLFGSVVSEWGGSVGAGVVVRLVGADGMVIDEGVTDDEGRYRMIDPELVAGRLVVDQTSGSEANGDLAGQGLEVEIEALRSGEERQLDVVVGTALELVGWVLDPAGSPQSGVTVSVVAEGATVRWRAVTDQGGGFRFPRVPQSPMRLTADGGDLGVTSVRVIPRGEARKDVTLVLEPTGTIMVMAAPEVKGEVLVRAYSAAAHGPDASWVEPLPEEYYPQPDVPEGEVGNVEPGGVEGEGNNDSGVNEDSMMKAMDEALNETLKDFDPERPVDGITAMVERMVQKQPLMEELFRMEVSKIAPGSEGKSMSELARLVAEKALEEEPQMVGILTAAAEKARNGKSGMEALMEASTEFSQENVSEKPEVNMEGEATEGGYEEPYSEVGEAATVEMSEAYPADAMPDYEALYAQSEAFRVQLVERFGEMVSAAYVDESVIVGRGRPGDEVRVRGSMMYQVAVLLEDVGPQGERYEIQCGDVLVPTGKTVDVYCGRAVETVLAGRVVDIKGRGVEGASVRVEHVDGAAETATTDKTGAYVVSFEVPRAIPCGMTVTNETGGELWRPSLRVNLACAPGHTVEVDPIVLRREEEAPALRLWEPFGGVGGMLQDGSEGVVLAGLSEDGPLAMDGIEEGSTILQVDEQEATTWSVEEMLARLRGDVGTDVMLRVRSPNGELVETVIQRGLITP